MPRIEAKHFGPVDADAPTKSAPIGPWLLGRDMRARVAAFAAARENPAVVAALPTV